MIFRPLQDFNLVSVQAVPSGPGIYIIYKSSEPFYIGRSRRDIRGRLLHHVRGTGSQTVAAAPRPLQFEYEHLISVEQVEAILIKEYGTVRLGNLRAETDPADWE